MSKAFTCILLGVWAAGTAPAGAEPAVVALARSYLGPESTLDAIRAIHYVGTLERVDADHGNRRETASLDMIFEKPLRQRLVVHGEKTTVTTVLDGYDAWDWLQDNADATRFRLTFLPPAEVRTLRANTWENLYYYLAPEGGTEEDKGPATVDGIACERVDFGHGADIVYERFFDRDTGRLVLTVRGDQSFRESGEIQVDGIRFPKSITSVTKEASGNELVSTATFERIALNESEPDSLFAVPSLAPPRSPAATAAPPAH